jgi:hypothetical protein
MLTKTSQLPHAAHPAIRHGGASIAKGTSSMASKPGHTAYRIAAAVAVAVSLLQIWMRMVGSEDNPANLGFFGVVITAGACAFTARFRAEGMARAMLATAGAQALIGLAVATAPISVHIERHGPAGVVMQSGLFVALWLISAGLFWRSARAAG